MSVSLPQNISHKNSTDSQETLELCPSAEISKRNFRDLLKVLPIDEALHEKNLFELVKEEEEEEKLRDGPILSLNSLSSSLDSPTEKTDRADVLENFCSPPAASIALSSSTSSSVALTPHPLPPDIELLFEKIACTMMVMSSSKEMETTLLLDNPTSIFYGTTITIREFSTAPKIFNVEILSSLAGIHAIDSSKNDLLSAFQNGNFNFSVHRLETFIHREDRPVLHRKESSDGHDHEPKGEDGE